MKTALPFESTMAAAFVLVAMASAASAAATTDAITFAALPVKTSGDGDFDPGATGNTGHIVEYSSTDTNVASIVTNSGGNLRVHIKKPGATAIVASQPAFAAFPAATPIAQPLWIWPSPRPVVGWGLNRYLASVPPGLDSCVAVAVGSSFSLALKGDGTVVAWGADAATVPTGLSDVVAIAAGRDHALALKRNGSVVAWGSNSYGQLSFPSGLNGVLSISAGFRHSLALKTDGSMVAWGDTSGGNLGSLPGTGLKSISDGREQSVWVDTLGHVGASGAGLWGPLAIMPLLRNVNTVSAGMDHVVFLESDSTVVASTARPSDAFPTADTSVPGDLRGVVAIAAGKGTTLALRSDSTIVAWGDDRYVVDYPAGLHGVAAIANGYGHALALGYAPVLLPQSITFPPLPVKTLGDPDFTPGATNDSGFAVTYASSDSSVASIVNGKIHIKKVGSTVITASSRGNATHSPPNPGKRPLWIWNPPRAVVGWGDNRFSEATPPDTLGNVVAIAANSSHSIALRSDGTVVVWGADLQPKFPSNLNGVVAVSIGDEHALALKSDGTVVSAGANQYGQGQVPADLADVVAIAAGNGSSMALKTDGTVVAWGNGPYGQSPAPVGLSDVIAISMGEQALALDRDGTVTGWGLHAKIPTSAKGLVSIAAGYMFGLGLNSDSTVAEWGDGGSGPVVPPSGLGGVVSIAAGDHSGMAMTSKGTAIAWGVGTGTSYATPTGLSGVTAIAAGLQCLALGSSPVPTIGFGSLADKFYGDSDFTPLATSSAGQPVTFSSSDPTTASVVDGKIHIMKAGNLLVTASEPVSAGYPAAVPVARPLSIRPRPDTVVAHAASKPVGGTEPVLTYDAAPLLAGDAWTGKLSRDPGEVAGTYAITQGTLTAGPNYFVHFVSAPFTIDPPTAIVPRSPRQVLSQELAADISRPFAAQAIGSGRGELGTGPLQSEISQAVQVLLPGPGAVSVSIFDNLGTPVIAFQHDVSESDLRRLPASGDGRRVFEVDWNLRASDGIAVPTGVYLWKIQALSQDGQKLETIKRLGVKGRN